jgi:hypothetical protein
LILYIRILAMAQNQMGSRRIKLKKLKPLDGGLLTGHILKVFLGNDFFNDKLMRANT